jgi:glutathionylspermidine synthase
MMGLVSSRKQIPAGSSPTTHDPIDAYMPSIGGSYANSSKIYQQLAKLSQIDGMYASIGSWVVGDEPAGICFREDTSPIIVDKSRFVPHMFFAAQ